MPLRTLAFIGALLAIQALACSGAATTTSAESAGPSLAGNAGAPGTGGAAGATVSGNQAGSVASPLPGSDASSTGGEPADGAIAGDTAGQPAGPSAGCGKTTGDAPRKWVEHDLTVKVDP